MSSASGVNGSRQSLLGLTLAVAAVVWLIDQLSKSWMVANLEGHPPTQVVGNLLRFIVIRNSGAAFSLGTGMTLVFTVIAIAVIVVIVRTARTIQSWPWALALGGLLGGALGNLTDRIFRAPGGFQGHVVDFVAVPHWAVFNVADMAVVCSAILMVILVLRGIPLSRPNDDSTESLASGRHE